VLSSTIPTAAGALGFGASVNFGDGSINHALAAVDLSQTLTNKTINGASNTLTVRAASDITGQLPIGNGGTGQATAPAAISALMPTPTRAGDIAYWNGSNWVTLAGNNSGTGTLQENASGLPVWDRAPARSPALSAAPG
jgi:hypothetical protein